MDRSCDNCYYQSQGEKCNHPDLEYRCYHWDMWKPNYEMLQLKLANYGYQVLLLHNEIFELQKQLENKEVIIKSYDLVDLIEIKTGQKVKGFKIDYEGFEDGYIEEED